MPRAVMPTAVELAERYPSVLWGEREWTRALRDDALFHHIMDGITTATNKALVDYHKNLTLREVSVLEKYAYGWSMEDMACFFVVDRETVASHLARARVRLRCGTLGQTVATAIGMGLVSAPVRHGPWAQPGPSWDAPLRIS